MEFFETLFPCASHLLHVTFYPEHDRITIVRLLWITHIFILYLIVHSIIRDHIKVFIKDRGIPKINQQRLVDAVWRIIFCSLFLLFYGQHLIKSEMLGLSNLALGISEVYLKPSCQNQTESFVVQEESNLSPFLLYYAAPEAFFFHQILILLRSCSSSSIFPLITTSAFIHATLSLSCLDLSAKVLLLIALNDGSLEVARACLALQSRCKGSEAAPPSHILNAISTLLFILHILIGLAVNFYLYPILFFSLPSVSEVNTDGRLSIAFINMFLTLYFPWKIFHSPLCSMLGIIVKQQRDKNTPQLSSFPSLVLLPYSSPLLHELYNLQSIYNWNTPLTSAEIRSMRRNLLKQSKGKPTHSDQDRTPQPAGAGGLLNAVKCMMALKKKMRHRWEFKHRGLELSGSPSPSSSDPVDDVTDIFIPVPAFSEDGHKGNDLSETESGVAGSVITSVTDDSSPVEENLESAEGEDLENNRESTEVLNRDQTLTEHNTEVDKHEVDDSTDGS